MGKAAHYVPERADIIMVCFSPNQGNEQAGKRPAVVLSPSIYNAVSGLAICCPITRTVSHSPFEVALPKTLNTSGVVLVEQVRSLAWEARSAKFVERVPAKIIHEITGKLHALTGDI